MSASTSPNRNSYGVPGMDDNSNASGITTMKGNFLQPPVLDVKRVAGVRPIRDVTKEEIETFQREGVVKLEGILPVDTATFLGECFDDMFLVKPARIEGVPLGARNGRGTSADHNLMADEVEKRGEGHTLLADGGYHEGKAKRTGRFMTEIGAVQWHSDFRRYCLEGPLPQVVAQLLQTSKLQYYNDHCFYKEKGSLLRSGFHQDSSFFNLSGDQVAVCWVPADVVTLDSGAMGYVRGSHRGPTYAPNSLLASKASEGQKEILGHMPDDVPIMPDIDNHMEDYPIVFHPAKPGDVVVHHQNTIHGSLGNTSTERHRRAASIRYTGDDVRMQASKVNGELAMQAYDPSNTLNPSTLSAQEDKVKSAKIYEQMKKMDGMKLPSKMFPLVWPIPSGAVDAAKL